VIKIAECCKGLGQKIKWSFKQADVGSSSHSFGGPSSVKRIGHDKVGDEDNSGNSAARFDSLEEPDGRRQHENKPAEDSVRILSG
jgi:hypothetical protein